MRRHTVLLILGCVLFARCSSTNRGICSTVYKEHSCVTLYDCDKNKRTLCDKKLIKYLVDMIDQAAPSDKSPRLHCGVLAFTPGSSQDLSCEVRMILTEFNRAIITIGDLQVESRGTEKLLAYVARAYPSVTLRFFNSEGVCPPGTADL